MSDFQLGKIPNVAVFPVAILILTVLNLRGLVANSVFALPKKTTNLNHAIDMAVCGVSSLILCFSLIAPSRKSLS